MAFPTAPPTLTPAGFDTWANAVTDTILDYNKFSGARVTKSAGQAIPTGTVTNVTWNTETFDVGGYHDNATNNSRLTIPAGFADAYYLLQAQLSWTGSTGGYRRFQSIIKNGFTSDDQGMVHTGPLTNATGALIVNWSALVAATAGDYFEVECFQDTGSDLSLIQLDENSWFSITRVGAA